MLTVTSEKTSLRDLTIAELRRVAWHHINPSEFAEDLNDINFLARMNYADRRIVSNWVEWGSILEVMEEAALDFVISSKKQTTRSHFRLDSDMWDSNKQYSIEFLHKNARHLYLNYAVRQKCITPEFLEQHDDDISYSNFFDRFLQYRELDEIYAFLNYKNGMFRRHIMQSRGMRYLTREVLESLDQPVPYYYDTVINEQRIMSGNPCDDGQRSFTIWLRKFRRVTGRPNDYPTWNEMLTLLKSHPRLNHNGYVDWIMSRCLENSPDDVARYPERLSYRPERVEREAYTYITGVDETQAEEDFKVEFADVIDPVNSATESVESEDSEGEESPRTGERAVRYHGGLGIDLPGDEISITPAMMMRVQPLFDTVRNTPAILRVSDDFDGDNGTEDSDEGGESES